MSDPRNVLAELDAARDACVAAHERWGFDAILGIVVEECAELTVAIQHYRRGRVPIEAVREELADVLVVAMDLALAIGEQPVATVIERKAARLRSRIRNNEPG